jgi:hypothetical protein
MGELRFKNDELRMFGLGCISFLRKIIHLRLLWNKGFKKQIQDMMLKVEGTRHSLAPFWGLFSVCGLMFLIVNVLMSGCAIVKNPEGGKKDEVAPVVGVTSPKNKATGFNKETIYISFDEKVVLDDPTNKIRITPTLTPKPKFKSFDDEITVDLSKSKLVANTTYQIVFDNAIKDLNEGNTLPYYAFVFSTGNQIDSNSIVGKVIDGFSLESKDKVRVGLYRKLTSDSSIMIKPADYFAFTKPDGGFEINYLPSDYLNYQLIAFEDKNNNQVWDIEEAIGKGVIAKDSIINIKLSVVEKVKKFQEIKTSIIDMFVYTNKRLSFVKDKGVKLTEYSQDSLQYYIPALLNEGRVAYSYYNQEQMKTNAGELIYDKANLKKMKFTPLIGTDNLYFERAESFIGIKSPIPLLTIERGYIVTKKDKVFFNYDLIFVDSLHTKLAIKVLADEGDKIKIQFLPGALTSILGKNKDTLTFDAEVPTNSTYGFINYEYKNNTKENHILEVLNDKKEVVFKKLVSSNSFWKGRVVLAKGNYSSRYIVDSDGNEKWTPINYFQKTEAEIIKLLEAQIIVKPNWEVNLKN